MEETNYLKGLVRNGVVIDLETQIVVGPDAKSTPSPWYGAKIVVGGQLWNVLEENGHYQLNTDFLGPTLIIGHNVKFDLNHLQYQMFKISVRMCEVLRNMANCDVWDTMIAEYYLSEQKYIMPSLELCCLLRGIPFKKDETISESFKLGLGADMVDKELLREYLKEDIYATRKVFVSQLEQALRVGGTGYVQYLIDMMGASIASSNMECYGIQIDKKALDEEAAQLEKEVAVLRNELSKEMAKAFPEDVDTPVDCNSPKCLATFLYGGNVKTSKQVVIKDKEGNPILYKSGKKKGQVRTKVMTDIFAVVSQLSTTVLSNGHIIAMRNKTGETSEQTLKSIYATMPGSSLSVVFIPKLLEFRRKNKDLNTYYQGIAKKVTVQNQTLHTNYNHALTKTKRLSASNPNLQNISNKSEGADDGH